MWVQVPPCPPNDMKVTVDSKKGLKTKLTVFVDKKTINDKIGERLIELSKKMI